MKLTNAQLKQIIKEELRSVLMEKQEDRSGLDLREFLESMEEDLAKHEFSVKEIMEKIMSGHTNAHRRKKLGPKPESVVDQRLGPEQGWWQIRWPAAAFDKLISILKDKASDWEDTNEPVAGSKEAENSNYGGDLWYFSRNWSKKNPLGDIKPWELS